MLLMYLPVCKRRTWLKENCSEISCCFLKLPSKQTSAGPPVAQEQPPFGGPLLAANIALCGSSVVCQPTGANQKWNADCPTADNFTNFAHQHFTGLPVANY